MQRNTNNPVVNNVNKKEKKAQKKNDLSTIKKITCSKSFCKMNHWRSAKKNKNFDQKCPCDFTAFNTTTIEKKNSGKFSGKKFDYFNEEKYYSDYDNYDNEDFYYEKEEFEYFEENENLNFDKAANANEENGVVLSIEVKKKKSGKNKKKIFCENVNDKVEFYLSDYEVVDDYDNFAKKRYKGFEIIEY